MEALSEFGTDDLVCDNMVWPPYWINHFEFQNVEPELIINRKFVAENSVI